MSISLENLRGKFIEMFGAEPRLFRAPGRVNLIGEHTDYNDGFVLPMAIDREAIVAASVRNDALVKIYAADVDQTGEFDFGGAAKKRRGSWMDYVEGVARMLKEKFPLKQGANLIFTSSVPVGAGLSSSAAIEIAVGYALLRLNDINVNKIQLAKAAQAAEHEFVGAKIGIMDQLTSVLGKAGQALLIDCRLLDVKPSAINFSGASFVVVDSGVKHDLATSEYNTRRAECEEGVRVLRQKMPDIRTLRDVSLTDFERFEKLLPNVLKRRCFHVLTENRRTIQAADALKFGKSDVFGRLMYESHVSLRDDYEVSSPELDSLVETASRVKGVFGARMTGGGFGGCTVNLVQRSAVTEFQEVVNREYEANFGIAPKIYSVAASDGASEIETVRNAFH
jgi:galactokinase